MSAVVCATRLVDLAQVEAGAALRDGAVEEPVALRAR